VRRACVTTLGCKVNQCDGDEIARSLAALGYEVVVRGRADVHVVNTCTVTATADAKARKLIRRLARSRPAVLVVTGCWAQREPAAAAALPGVDAVVPNHRKEEIPALVARLAPPGPSEPRALPLHRTRAFLKLQDGCDHRCAYCAVPDARGAPTSKPLPHALAELQSLAAAGAREVVLCGIRLGAYGRDRGEAGLAALLRELRSLPIPRLRLSSLEPLDVSADLLAEIAGHPTLCHHLHLPLQSGSDAVLAAMGRGHTSGDYASLLGRIRAAWPAAAITTDVMVGFPGETDQQFRETLAFLRRGAFTRVHVFPYSPRPGTPAASRQDHVPIEQARARTCEMLRLAEDLAGQAAAAWVGREVQVLFERQEAGGLLTGLTEHYLRVRCAGPADCVGRIRGVTPYAADGAELLARA